MTYHNTEIDLSNNEKLIKTFPAIVKLDESKFKITEFGNVEVSKSVLPDEYQQLEYIESTGTQYIDTNLELAENMNMNIELQFLQANGALWGCTKMYFETVIQLVNSFQIRIGEGNLLTDSFDLYGRKIIYAKDKNVYYNNEQVSFGNKLCSDSILLFAERLNDTIRYGTGRIGFRSSF